MGRYVMIAYMHTNTAYLPTGGEVVGKAVGVEGVVFGAAPQERAIQGVRPHD